MERGAGQLGDLKVHRPVWRTGLVGKRWVYPSGAVLLILVLVAAFGLGNRIVFDQRASGLEATWAQEREAGVSRAELAPLRQQLAATEQRSEGPLPYPYYSLALFSDPLSGLDQRTGAVYHQALLKNRKAAQADLVALQADYGPTPFAAASHQKQLAQASTPEQYLRLVKAWTVEGAQVTASRDALAKAAGGLTKGLPADIVADQGQIQAQAQALTQAQLWTDPEAAGDATATAYLKESYAQMAQQHASVAQQLNGVNQTLNARLELNSTAQNLISALPALIQNYGQNTDDSNQLQQAQAALTAAESAHNDGQMGSAVSSMQSLDNQLVQAQQAAEASSTTVDTTSCLPNKASAPAQEVVVHLTAEELVAYTNGCPWLSTPVTTGMAGLRTDQGTFQIFGKYPEYTMVSPWPTSSPYWYPTTVVPDAMEFVSDGTFLHGAPWEPDDAMGPGSEDGPYASHGCVHLPSGALAQVFAWANIGATVVVQQ